MENMHLLNLSLLVKIGGEILAPLCSDDSCALYRTLQTTKLNFAKLLG